jgi:two-component system phosphate regulon sensor histidine kinase PhoR
VDDLLLLSRLESGVPEEENEEIDLSLLAAALIEDEKVNPLARHIEWEISLAPHVVIQGRQGELIRALGNILDNAVKYTHRRFAQAGGGKISVQLKRQDGEGLFLVSDNGVGIKPELRESVFERFQRGEPDRARGTFGKGGYGLGLAIAKKIIEAHGGRILVPPVEEGASFEIRLPL